jgi:hypothetical protein
MKKLFFLILFPDPFHPRHQGKTLPPGIISGAPSEAVFSPSEPLPVFPFMQTKGQMFDLPPLSVPYLFYPL